MNYFRFLTLVAAIFCLLAFPASLISQDRLGESELARDLEQFATELPVRHVNLFHKFSKAEFEALVDALRKDLGSIKQVDFAFRLSQILAEVGDGHTSIAPDINNLTFFPINFKVLDDGIFVRAIKNAHRMAVGAKLVSIGPMSSADVYQQLAGLIPHDNEQGLKNILDLQMNTAESLQFIGAAVADGPTEFKFEKNGKQFSIKLEPIKPRHAGKIRWATPDLQPALYQQKNNLDHWNDWIADSKTLYFKYNRCRNQEAFQKLVDGTAGFVEQNDVRRFVLDLRDNGGGDSRIFAPLLSYLKSNEQLNQKGRLFVIIGRRTFSSAVMNAIDMKLNTNATLIGEGTGGKPNHFGEVKVFELENSKLKVQYSTKKFNQMAGNDDDTLRPDHVIELTSENWFNGGDPFLNYALEYVPK